MADPKDYEAPRWVHVGQKVWAPLNVRFDAFYRPMSIDGKAIQCVVTMAAGDAARVENQARGFSELMGLDELRVPVRPDPADPYKCLPPPPEPQGGEPACICPDPTKPSAYCFAGDHR